MNKPAIIYTAFQIMDLKCGASCNTGMHFDFQRQRSLGDSWRDWAIDVTRRLPDDLKLKEQIFDYARGVGEATYAVRLYLGSIPDEVWTQGEHILEVA